MTYKYDRSKVLFWLDRRHYEDNVPLGKTTHTKPTTKKSPRLITPTALWPRFKTFSLSVERGRVVPFVRAGMSKPMGMPLVVRGP